MKKSIHSRLPFSVAAIAFCLCFASAAFGAESEIRKDAPQNDAHRSDPQPSEAKQGEAQPNEAKPLDTPAQETTTPPDFGPQTAQATAETARRYAAIAAAGGWPRIAKAVGPGAKGKPVVDLRRRLAAENLLAQEDADAPVWDAKLTDALTQFQSRVGLKETGTISPATLRELNVSAAERARALEATAERLSKVKFGFGERYVDVNIPAAEVETVENGRRLESFTAIVGDPKNASPQITANIQSVLVNPAWTVPASIVKRELAPALRRNPAYLASRQIRVFDGRGREVDLRRLRGLSSERAAMFTFRQDPGPKNSLGSLHLDMPNKDEVYMHDTPNKELFERDYRFLSHGCVRVEGIYDLATWLLQEPGQPGEWDQAALRRKVDEGKTETIKLRRPTPVAWVYMTGWASPDGATHFRHDIYKLDKGAALPQPKSAASAQKGASSRARPRR
jgi:murein L,D-transpeptidase YcbB/YkuD